MPFSQRFYKTLAVLAVSGLAVASYTTYDLYQGQGELQQDSVASAKARDEAIREAAIKNCHQVGDPLLTSQKISLKNDISDIQEQLAQAKTLDLDALAQKLGIPKQQLLDSQQRQRDRIARDQAALDPLLAAPSCAERYPPLNG